MAARQVDVVLVVDASESMRPCFDALKTNLKEIAAPVAQAGFSLRIAIVAYAAGRGPSGVVYDHTFIGGSGPDMLHRLYGGQATDRDFFTSDARRVSSVLDGLRAQGNEDTLLALDIAADLPFGPTATTQRVIALFTDEPLEDGISEREPLEKLPALVRKLTERRIQLFAAAPYSDALAELGSADRSEIEPVDGNDGLRSVDFKKLLAQMGKSISVSTLQSGPEPRWQRALFGQDRWGADRVTSAANRDIVLAVGETASLGSGPISQVHIRLEWREAVDLDLHAFCQHDHDDDLHVYFANKTGPGIELDRDAGVGDRGGDNFENIVISRLGPFKKILFATKIFRKGGSYSDYDARIVLVADGYQTVTVPLTARETADWCVIAVLERDSRRNHTVRNVNRVTMRTPDLADY